MACLVDLARPKFGIPILLAISCPPSLAVELATKLNMTLACLADKSGLLSLKWLESRISISEYRLTYLRDHGRISIICNNG